jgi:hypothetical protein
MISVQRARVRAGFWRRQLSLLIDIAVVSVPFQLIVAVLFVATTGLVQLSWGLTSTQCEMLKKVPDGLTPPPPAGSNFARSCNVYFFGVQTARGLIVGRATREGMITKTVSQEYMLDRDGHPVNGVSIDWIVILSLIIYLIVFETRTGVTLGNRAMRIRVIDAIAPSAWTVRLRRIVTRYVAMLIGLLPLLAIVLFYAVWFGGDVDDTAAGSLFAWVQMAAIAAAFGWMVWQIVQVARKRDPVYDKIAGTAVVRVASDARANSGTHRRGA